MSEQVVVGTDVVLPRGLVLHTLEQRSWPWTFDFLVRAVGRQRMLPLDPVLLFWPLSHDDRPALADGDTEDLSPNLLFPDRYELRLVSRREGELACKGWPDTRDFFAEPAPPPAPDPLKPVSKPTPRERRSPFDPH